MNNHIDFVLPWVNNQDLHWQAIRAKYAMHQSNHDGNSEARFRDMETLKYVLRSIEKNCPWYHRIILITEGHTPDWLNVNHPKIKVLTHQEFYKNNAHLPTFNASSIEANLPHITDISEQFVYLNDDMLILQPTEISRFFVEGKPVDFLAHGWLARQRLFSLLRPIDAWIGSLNYQLFLLNKTLGTKHLTKNHLYHSSYSLKTKISNFLMRHLYKKALWIGHWHHPQSYLKSTLQTVYAQFQQEIDKASANKFRQADDITQYIYRYWQLLSGNFYPGKFNDDLEKNVSSLSILNTMLQEVDDKKPRFVCFNDSPTLSGLEYEVVKQTLLAFLEKKLPEKASFEC